MKLNLLFTGARSMTFRLESEDCYELAEPAALLLNGKEIPAARTVVSSLYDLEPDTEYVLTSGTDTLNFRTAKETCTLDVRAFGAAGDGVHEDTAAIQTAILACPAGGRVLIPEGKWLVLPLFLKSSISIEFAKGAELHLVSDRNRFPILPGKIPAENGVDEFCYGTWEGDPYDSFAGMLTGIDVENCVLYGEGLLDGSGNLGDWWVNPKVKRVAWRGNMLYLHHCRNITVQGLHIKNSPSWNLHPYFSDDLKFLNLTVEAPFDSPNTDGFDPESCARVLMAGTRFSLGDDCIAIKSGKLYMGQRYKTPCCDLEIAHCLMENGHGGVTVGSEMAGGVRRVRVHHCVMRHTDRGLRIKTRRGRGKDGILDEILMEKIIMDHVGTPFVINGLYFCDPDGHSEYVQTLEKLPVDERTPRIGPLYFRDIDANGAACAGYFLGIPEKPIELVRMENIRIACDPEAEPMQPAMADCVGKMTRTGLVIRFADRVELKNVEISGCDAPDVITEQVGCVVRG